MAEDIPINAKTGSAWDHYARGKVLGSGNFSTVTMGIAKNVMRFGVEKVAVKTCPRDDAEKVNALRHEWRTLSDIGGSHPNLNLAYEYFEDDEECSMVIEYAAHGTMLNWLQNTEITERQACKVVAQVLGAVTFLHELGYVHRDIKPHNILIADLKPLTIRLADFGLSKKCGLRGCRNSAGDLDFICPDMLAMMDKSQPCSAEEYQKNDIYAVGVCMYFLLSGHPPYPKGEGPRSQARDFPWVNPPCVTFPKVKQPTIDMCRKLMAYDDSDRPEGDEALGWFQMQRQGSSTSNMSMTRTGSNTMGSSPIRINASGEASLLCVDIDGGEGGDQEDEDAEKLARHQTDMTEEEFDIKPTGFREGLPEEEHQEVALKEAAEGKEPDDSTTVGGDGDVEPVVAAD